MVAWSDGIPYLYGCDLQDNLIICSKCSDIFHKVSVDEHRLLHDNSEHYSPLIDFLILRPGPGHIELNMAKALLAVLWIPFLSDFAKELGFRSPKAQDIVRKGIDHHRSRQILGAILEALSCELLVPFVKLCKLDGVEATTTGYFSWVESNVLDPVYLFLFHMCFTFILSFHLYNKATRKNNHTNMMAARVAYAPFFFGTPHPKYRELHLRDMCQRVQYPQELADYMVSHESFSISSVDNRGQGADFVHEEVNKLIK